MASHKCTNVDCGREFTPNARSTTVQRFCSERCRSHDLYLRRSQGLVTPRLSSEKPPRVTSETPLRDTYETPKSQKMRRDSPPQVPRDPSETMTKGKRTELGQLIRKREKVMKAATDERGAVLLAEFEQQISTIYRYDDDATWKAAFADAERICAEAQEKIAERARERGIPRQFAPGISIGWYGRGENAVRQRRDELRRVAKAQIDVLTKSARTKIERISLQAQTEVLANGLVTPAARAFLDNLQPVESLMPTLDFNEIKKLTGKDDEDSRPDDNEDFS